MKSIASINKESWQRFEYKIMGKPELDIHESWYHITKNGGYHATHSHGACSWCAIYYVEVGDRDENGFIMGGKNRFFKPFATSYYDPGLDYLYNNSVYIPDPEDGVLVIFPSYLLHCADPYEGRNKDRIVIAMNMKINVNKEEINAEKS